MREWWWARRLARRIRLTTLLAVAALSLSSDALFAYGQLYPPGGANAIGTCENTDQSPCIRWRKTGNDLSITVNVFLNDNLNDEEVNLKVDARNSIEAFNSIPARNPHLEEAGDVDLKIRAQYIANPLVYGGTSIDRGMTAPYRIDSVKITFNTQIVWNRDLDFHCEVFHTLHSTSAMPTHARFRIMRWDTPKALLT